MGKMLESAKALAEQVAKVTAAQTPPAAGKPKAEGEEMQETPAPDGGGDMESRLKVVEEVCNDLKTRVEALEASATESETASEETAKALDGVKTVLAKISFAVKSPALARIGAGAAAGNGGTDAGEQKDALATWKAMPEGAAKDAYLKANADAINSAANAGKKGAE